MAVAADLTATGSARAGIATPVGRVWVAARDGAIVASGWGEAGAADGPEAALLDRALAEIDAYFAGRLTRFEVPLRPAAEGFQARFLDALRAIPFGETRTYGDLARSLQVPAQAIGQACGGNPLPILIPCHRVLGASGLGGYSGAGGVETKVALLRLEGAGGLLI